MRKPLPGIVELGRKQKAPDGGSFVLKHNGIEFLIVASWGMGWEHVSVSTEDRTPTWEEMCWVKDLFWDEEECVVQYHPPRSKHVNIHPYCLHLWRPLRSILPVPRVIMV